MKKLKMKKFAKLRIGETFVETRDEKSLVYTKANQFEATANAGLLTVRHFDRSKKLFQLSK